MEIKDILKSRRLELNLTLKDISEKVGVTIPTISRWESGDIANMRRDKIVSYAMALNISPAVIMGWEEPTSCSSPPAPTLSLTQQEETHIKKYRQLDADGKEEIDDIIDVKLAKLQRKAEEDVESLG
mgnify:CR=1 FL=1